MASPPKKVKLEEDEKDPLPTPTVFEKTVFLHQPTTLKQCTGKAFSFVVMQEDDFTRFEKLDNQVKDLCAIFLTGRWFLNYFKLRGQNSLTTLEKNIDQEEKKHQITKPKILFMLFLRHFLSLMNNHNPQYEILRVAFKCYMSSVCKSLDFHPTRLYAAGIREGLGIWILKADNYVRNYLASDALHYIPTFDLTNVPDELTNFSQEIFFSYSTRMSSFLEFYAKNDRMDVPRKLCWIKYFMHRERFPEALALLLACLMTLDPSLHSPIEHLDVFSLAIFTFARLHINIRATSLLIFKAFTFIKHDYEKHCFARSLVTYFTELGHFKLAHNIYYKFLDPISHSFYHYKTKHALIEGLLEQAENICLYVITIREYHKRCDKAACFRITAQGEHIEQLKYIIKDLLVLINSLNRTDDVVFYGLQTKLIQICYFLFLGRKDHRPHILSLIHNHVELLKLNSSPSSKLVAELFIMNDILKNRGEILNEHMFTEQVSYLTKSVASSLKCKILFKSSLWVYCFTTDGAITLKEKKTIGSLLDTLLPDLTLITNGKSYRLRLIRIAHDVFFKRKLHVKIDLLKPIENLKFKTSFVNISPIKLAFFNKIFAPNFAKLKINFDESGHCTDNEDRWSDHSIMPFYSKDEIFFRSLLRMDPFMKNHLCFGVNQLKFREVNYQKPGEIYVPDFAPVQF